MPSREFSLTGATAGVSGVQWLQITPDNSRYLELNDGTANRQNATWYCGWTCVAPDGLTFDVGVTDGKWHKFTLYAVGSPGVVPELDFEVRDAVGHVIETRSLTNYLDGVYLSWNVHGNISIHVSVDPSLGNYPQVGGYFLDPSDAAVKSIALSGGGQTIPDGTNGIDTVNGTDFGFSALGVAQDRTYTITNTGNQTVNLTGSSRVVVLGNHATDFSVLTQPPSSLSGGASTTFTLRFRPTASGARTARINILNDTDQAAYDFAIGGIGTP
jgi:hypothetical protein